MLFSTISTCPTHTRPEKGEKQIFLKMDQSFCFNFQLKATDREKEKEEDDKIMWIHNPYSKSALLGLVYIYLIVFTLNNIAYVSKFLAKISVELIIFTQLSIEKKDNVLNLLNCLNGITCYY